MEPILTLVYYATLVAAAGGLVVLQPRASAWARRRRVTSWHAVAVQRGLDWHGERASGWMGEHYVAVWPENGNNGPLNARVAVALWPPLDLGLVIESDDPNGLRVDDGERASPLIGPLRTWITGHPPRAHITLKDDWIVLFVWGLPTAARIDELLRYGTGLAEQIDRLRSEVRPARALESIARQWRTLAERRRYAMTTTPFGFTGNEKQLAVRVFAKRLAPNEFAAAAHAAFRQPLHIGFRARLRQSTGESPWSMEPFAIGDPVFDAALTVDAYEREYVGVAFNERARARLLEVAPSCQAVVVDDYGVLLQSTDLSGSNVERLLDDAVSTAELVDFVHPKVDRGYR